MKYLIVGLGNIGPEYVDTRHNVGFKVADALADGASFESDKWGYSAWITYKGRKIKLLKPTTYMNLSGKAIAYHLQKESIPLENLLVVTDDIALPLGSIRLRPKGSDGGHNGLKDIQLLLNTTDYPRLRVGVGSNFPKGMQADYVLAPFEQIERPLLLKVIELAKESSLIFVFQGIERAMTLYNNKKAVF